MEEHIWYVDGLLDPQWAKNDFWKKYENDSATNNLAGDVSFL